MKQYKNHIIATAILLIGTYIFMIPDAPPTPVQPQPIMYNKEDIKTIIDASVSSLQQQAKLIILSTNFNAVATSYVKSYSMTAKQTDISTVEVQYTVDMRKITYNNFEVKGKTVYLTIPKSSIKGRFINEKNVTYRNDGWLFTLSDVESSLNKRNKELITQSFNAQKENIKKTFVIKAVEVEVRNIIYTIFAGADIDKNLVVKVI